MSKEMNEESTVMAEALEMLIRKDEDYNKITPRAAYFPFGLVSYAHMLNTKALRIVSLAHGSLAGEEPNYESVRDSFLDLINYAAMGIVALDSGEMPSNTLLTLPKDVS